MLYEVIPTKLFRANSGILTYSSDLKLLPGHIVRVPLGRSSTLAIVYQSVKSVDFPTKDILELVYPTPLPTHILKSIFWLSKYYLSPLPVVAKLFLSGVPEKPVNTHKILTKNLENTTSIPEIPLNSAQKQAILALESAQASTKLLHGVTGSGKTNVYLDQAKKTIKAQKSVILMVPEIALTSQLVQVFESYFKNQIILIHSKQTPAERRQIFEQILSATTPIVVIGPRSALTTPVQNLGLIIIDEAHETSYYQENTPRYSSLRLASYIASTLKSSCIYGSATPLVADYYLADHHNSLVTLSEKAKSTAIEPEISIIDLKDRNSFTKNRYFSDELLEAIRENLKSGYQTLIFHNRRGSAPLTICEECGWQALCPNCYLPLNLHTDSFSLICHACGHSTNVPTICPECQHAGIIHKGFGTKLLENELNKLFKEANIIRFDADNKKSETLDANFDAVKAGKFDIIIGTQTIAKGLDLPKLATVGVVQADAGLSLPDYASEEKTFELINQVIGRVGRGHIDKAQVVVQTYQPNHPAIVHSLSSDYSSFAKYLLKNRRAGHLPPFYYLAKISVTYKTESIAHKYARDFQKALSVQNSNLIISAPTPAFHERTTSGYTWQLILRSTSRADLISTIKTIPSNQHTHVTIDPLSLL